MNIAVAPDEYARRLRDFLTIALDDMSMPPLVPRNEPAVPPT
jgi:hypothetical protein